jgi:Tol biopolymer transport system component
VVRDPRWAGEVDDTRIAYRSGDDLRVIAGDGNPATDRLIARDVAPVPPVWRPLAYAKLAGAAFVLSYIDGAGHVVTVDAETGQRVRTTRVDDQRLPGPGSAHRPSQDRAISPDGSRVAQLEHVGATDRLLVTRPGADTEQLFFARTRLTGPTWSPDGRWILVGWPAADQWLFINVDHPNRTEPFSHISEQFDPGGDGPAPFPSVSGWILPER